MASSAPPFQPQPKSRYHYQTEIQHMMFIHGEVSDPNEQTTRLMEDITRSQVTETIIQACTLCNKRLRPTLIPEDFIFIMRNQHAKVTRMKTFLSWKDVRKNTKEGENDVVEDVEDRTIRPKKIKVKLVWDLVQSFTNVLSADEESESGEESGDDQGVFSEQLVRLKVQDEITKSMTKEEYIYYSECRQASFTFKKAKKFKEWCRISQYIDCKISTDVIDVLGFLAYDIVCRLTERALLVKKEWDNLSCDIEKAQTAENANYLFGQSKTKTYGLEPRHIHEAFRLLSLRQSVPLKKHHTRRNIVLI